MADSSKNVLSSDSDVHITLEDQQKINLFARFNAKNDEFKAEIQSKQNEVKNYDDAEDEMMMRDDDAGDVPIMLGDNFYYMDASKATETLKKLRQKTQDEIKTMQGEMLILKDQMSDLKTKLYAKFGTHINLESDD